jgi:hypothetical protein
VNFDDLPLSAFEVDCDGSACGSGDVGRHIHPPQDDRPAIARVNVRNGQRVGYFDAAGITRLVHPVPVPGTGEED